MSKHEPVPALRRARANPLFSDTSKPERVEPKHVKVTVYMPPEMVAGLDGLRASLRGEGVTVDRGALIRACIDMQDLELVRAHFLSEYP